MPENKKIAFNLKTAEKEKTHEPFVVGLEDGETIVLNDPRDLDWQTLASLDNPVEFMRHCVSEEDKEKLRVTPIPGWKFALMIEAFQVHYGIGTPGNGSASRI